MTQFTQDKWLNFVIENYSEIKSLIEVWEHAKSNLPNRINSAIIDYITELKGSYFEDKDILIGGEAESIWWYEEDHYNADTDLGIFFEFDGIEGKDCITSESFGESAFFYFHINPHGKNAGQRTEEINQKCEIFKKKRKGLDSEIIILPDDDDPQRLAKYCLKNLNINALKTPEKLKKYIQDAVIKFTDEILKILRVDSD